MIELLILYLLCKSNNTQYGISKIIKDKFSYLSSSTLGSIHPAFMRLLDKGFVIEEKSLTKGGRRKNVFSVTKEGKQFLINILKADIPMKTPNLEKMINTKLACSDVLEEDYRKTLYVKIIRYFEYQIFNLNKAINSSEYTQMQRFQVKNILKSFEDKIEMLSELI